MSKQSDELAQIADHLDSDKVSINDIDHMGLRLRKLSKWFEGLDKTAQFLKRKTNELEAENKRCREALERIAHCNTAPFHKIDFASEVHLQCLASEALKGEVVI